MNAKLAKHLLRSPHVRAALRKELLRLLVFVVIYIGVTAASRYFREKPIYDGVIGASFGAIGIALYWFTSAIRTLRATLREHSLLEP